MNDENAEALAERSAGETVEGDSSSKIERSLRRIPNNALGCHVFDLAYDRRSVPNMGRYLAQAIREVQPLWPVKGWYT